MTNTTYAQVFALQRSFSPSNLTVVEATEALDVAVEALRLGLPPLQAINAAASRLYAGYSKLSAVDRNELMVETLNGLLAADRVERLGPRGILPLALKVEKK